MKLVWNGQSNESEQDADFGLLSEFFSRLVLLVNFILKVFLGEQRGPDKYQNKNVGLNVSYRVRKLCRRGKFRLRTL